MKKKAMAIPVTFLVILVAFGAIIWIAAGNRLNTQGLNINTGSSNVQSSPDAVQACNGVSSVLPQYNDFDVYAAGTDPASTLTLYQRDGEPFKKTIADDATSTTLPVRSTFKGVAGTNVGTEKAGYFSELVDLTTTCTDDDVVENLYPASAPTLTVVNSNGITVNSDANDEALAANDKKTITFKAVAPANACSMRHGANLVIMYSSTVFDDINPVTGLTDGSQTIRWGYNQTGNAQALTPNQYAVFDVPGSLCNGEEGTYRVQLEVGGTGPSEDQNLEYYWYGKDYTINPETYTLMGPTIYDESGNLIGEAGVNGTIYLS
jgi:hypothetical protein